MPFMGSCSSGKRIPPAKAKKTETQIVAKKPAMPAPPKPAPPKPAPPKIPVATVNVTQMQKITNSESSSELLPRLNPGGNLVLYTVKDYTKSDEAKYSLAMTRIGQAGSQPLIGPYASSATWFPDGKSYVFSYRKTNKPILVRSGVEQHSMTFITQGPLGDYDNQPDVSPDGKTIAFHTKMGDTYNICTIGVNGSNFTLYTEGSSPKWSPDGSKILFDRRMGSVYQIFVVDLKSGQVTQLTTNNSNYSPNWSPGGEWITFVSDMDGNENIYVMKNDGSYLTQLTTGSTEEDQPFWGKDGFIYFVSDSGSSGKTKYYHVWRLRPVLKY